MLKFLKKHRTALCLAGDIAVLGIFFYYIPVMRRPLEFLCIAGAVLGMVNAAGLKTNAGRNAALAVLAVSVSVFALELAQKIWGITDMFGPSENRPERSAPAPAGTNPYAWNGRLPETYFAARERAIADLDTGDAFEEHFAGDIFPSRQRESLWVQRSAGGAKEEIFEALKPMYRFQPPLGYELTPENTVRHYARDRASGRMLWDGRSTVNASGFRETAGSENGGTVLFLGCSVTYGFGLSDDQTTAHYYSEAGGFAERVLNFGVSGYGTHHVLRELETNLHAARAGVDPARVTAVYYTLIDDHAVRAANPVSRAERGSSLEAPRYHLENGRAVFSGSYADSPVTGRLAVLLDRSRIYPEIREKLSRKESAGGYKWDLVYAMLAEMDRICRERYNVGLTVVYVTDTPEVRAGLEASGIRWIRAGDALDVNWQDRKILYSIADGHPNAHMNRAVGRHLWQLREKAASETDNF